MKECLKGAYEWLNRNRPDAENQNFEAFTVISALVGEVEKSGWISVDERLPENGDSYLVVIKEKEIFYDKWLYHVDVASSHGSYIDDFWDTFNDWCEGQEVHVTHWMPLPTPPEVTP